MHKATYALLILVCTGSAAGLYLTFNNQAYRSSTAVLSCTPITSSCYAPLVRNLLP